MVTCPSMRWPRPAVWSTRRGVWLKSRLYLKKLDLTSDPEVWVCLLICLRHLQAAGRPLPFISEEKRGATTVLLLRIQLWIKHPCIRAGKVALKTQRHLDLTWWLCHVNELSCVKLFKCCRSEGAKTRLLQTLRNPTYRLISAHRGRPGEETATVLIRNWTFLPSRRLKLTTHQRSGRERTAAARWAGRRSWTRLLSASQLQMFALHAEDGGETLCQKTTSMSAVKT